MRPIPPSFAAAVLTFSFAGGFSFPADPGSSRPPAETVRAALASGRADALSALLPAGERIDLDLLTVPRSRGLHGGRQAQVLIQKRFDLCSPGGLESFDSTPSDDEAVIGFRAVVSCGRPAPGSKLRLRGTIESRSGSWALKELREVD